jgi:hypothetical protein
MAELMRKILDFHSPSAWYACDAAILTCFDSRFDAICLELLQRLNIARPDTIKVAGGAKTLASPEEEFHRAFVVDQIHKSIRLHGTGRLILTLHSDCGAYGRLSGGFRGDAQAEMAHYCAEFERSKEFLRGTFPKLQVDCFVLGFDGVWASDASSIMAS